MVLFQHELRTTRAADSVLLAAAAGLSLYYLLRPILAPKPDTVISAKGRAIAARLSASSDGAGKLPYPPDVFPGARDVDTPYGTIKVFEWGSEDGEKVLLMHGIGTPCVALGDMANGLVSRGYRVMLFDFFGRGYSDAPVDVPYDSRLYTSQLLLVLASSYLPWTGAAAFHLVGYSLGGALAAAFAAHHPHMLRSLTLICPGGLVRTSHVSLKSRLLYSEQLLPAWLLTWLARRRLEPRRGASADVPEGENADVDVDFDEVPVSQSRKSVKVGDVVKWQLQSNEGFVGAYMSTIRSAPIYGQHGGIWQVLSKALATRRASSGDAPPGLASGRICLILAEKDPIVVKEEWIEDSTVVLGEDGFEARIVKGGHEIAISKGKEVADVAVSSWQSQGVTTQ